ncbi:MAG: antitoxin Xre/MbcA/ParS toxin-binding domain-containing protein [Geminicoccaceae bacterium]
MISSSRVVQLLGGDETLPGPAERSDALERAVRAGLPFAVVRRLIEAGRLTVAEVTTLALPRTTYGRRAREGVLSEAESERIERLARVIATAEEVFLDQGRAGRWLRAPHPELDGRPPLEVAASELGARRIETMLWQIAHGIAA